MRFKGKIALITGGGSGIGYTIAEHFIREGCNVVIASRNLQRVQHAAETLKPLSNDATCLAVKCDVRNPQDVMACVQNILTVFKKIDILINCAAGNFLCPAAGLSFNGFRTVMEIDAIGTFNTSKACFDAYMKNHGGVILNISATLHYRGTPFQAHAGAAKAAVDALTRHLAVEWGPLGVRVLGVAPGPIEGTPGFDKLGGDLLRGDDNSFKIAALVPIGRLGKRSDIARLVLFLVSDEASFVHGETVVADGGSWLVSDGSVQNAEHLLNSALSAADKAMSTTVKSRL